MVQLNKCCWHSDGELGCQPSSGVMARGGGRGDLAFPSAFWAVFAPQLLLGILLIAPSSSPGAACSLRGAQARLLLLLQQPFVCEQCVPLLWGVLSPGGLLAAGMQTALLPFTQPLWGPALLIPALTNVCTFAAPQMWLGNATTASCRL